MTCLIETYGCQMNIAESAALTLTLKERGWTVTGAYNPSTPLPRLVILNTCAVRATAETRLLGRLAFYTALKKRAEHPLSILITGCMASRLRGELLERGADYTVAPTEKERLPLVLAEIETPRERSPETPAPFAPLHHQKEQIRAFLPIMSGCNNFCSYCIVPYVRGRETSRELSSITAEIQALSEAGVREITLLGQNVNSYHGSLDFAGLLESVARTVEGTGIRWVRFLSSHPKDLSPQAIEVMARHSCFCAHLHLCAQHGSNRVLAAMNRGCTRERYLALVRALRGAIPGLTLSTDILVGFPGESEAEFEEVLTLMEEVKFLNAYTYHYNPREGTAAYNLPDRVSEEVKRERLSRVIALQKRHTREVMQSRLGSTETALIEGPSRRSGSELRCRTPHDDNVIIPRAAGLTPGAFAAITLQTLAGATFRGSPA